MSTPPDSPANSAVLNFVVRMVVPMRREFGRSLDVQQFMRDAAYARAVLEQARTSRDQRLLDYAEYVSRHLGGAREVDPPPHGAEPAQQPMPPSAGPDVPAAAGDAGDATAAEMRARMLRKYTSGLR